MRSCEAYIFILMIMASFCSTGFSADSQTREKVIEVLKSTAMSDKIEAPVTITSDDSGVIAITDEGSFVVQYLIMTPQLSAEPNLLIDDNVKIPPTANKIVIVTHGWIDKGRNDWPSDIIEALSNKVDPNEWVCSFFDWAEGAGVVSPIYAAQYSRDIAGPRLAKAILNITENPNQFKHIHLIAHSAGAWVINSAARIIATQTKATIHLTFLDAYVPPSWSSKELGNIETTADFWAEHYYTKDFTLNTTHHDLPNAHNVDITKIDPWFKEHEFPYRWYYATVVGKYQQKDWERKEPVATNFQGVNYGFVRSREAGKNNWQKSLILKRGKKALKADKLEQKKQEHWFD